MPVTLVTGPVRSGKSRFVRERAEASGRRVRYVATAARDPGDVEWEARIRRHESDRPRDWELVESAGLSLEELLDVFRSASRTECVVVDALGTWLAARIAQNVEAFREDAGRFETQLDEEAARLADAMIESEAAVFAVSEEVGWDVVPVERSARVYRDVLGRMKQRIAARADGVYLIVSGLALELPRMGPA
jgi:adenosylcobinamide kinase / adenosylcobinamide-phosphate guanylyltransferase